jgi:hypothetical protein
MPREGGATVTGKASKGQRHRSWRGREGTAGVAVFRGTWWVSGSVVWGYISAARVAWAVEVLGNSCVHVMYQAGNPTTRVANRKATTFTCQGSNAEMMTIWRRAVSFPLSSEPAEQLGTEAVAAWRGLALFPFRPTMRTQKSPSSGMSALRHAEGRHALVTI